MAGNPHVLSCFWFPKFFKTVRVYLPISGKLPGDFHENKLPNVWYAALQPCIQKNSELTGLVLSCIES